MSPAQSEREAEPPLIGTPVPSNGGLLDHPSPQMALNLTWIRPRG